MKIITEKPGKQDGPSPLASQDTSKAVEAMENSSRIEINAGNVADYAKDESTMSDYEKAVVSSFAEADKEEAEQIAAEAKKKDVEAKVDVAAHTAEDPLLESAAGTGVANEPVKITKEQKDAFCMALITNARYTENFSLFGGKVTAKIRSRTLEETDSIEAYLRYKVSSGVIRTAFDYSNLARKILLTAQVQEFNGVKYDEMARPMSIREDKDGVKLPAWEEQLDIWGRQSNAVAVALTRCLAEFEARYWFMVKNANDTDFWDRGESTVE